jgi:hypothetical protein
VHQDRSSYLFNAPSANTSFILAHSRTLRIAWREGVTIKATVTLQDLLTTAGPTPVTPFQAVGIAKRARIMLRHVYIRRHGGKDMPLTSAVRDPIATFNRSPRAINMMPKGVRRKAHVHGTAATDNGTDLIY